MLCNMSDSAPIKILVCHMLDAYNLALAILKCLIVALHKIFGINDELTFALFDVLYFWFGFFFFR